jgi:uncharacterized protein
MRNLDGRWILSPRDLIGELECNHRLSLDWSAATGLISKPLEENSKDMELLIDRGRAHEQRLVDKYRALGTLVSIGDPTTSIDAINKAAEKTNEAINQGIEVIHQATLFTGDFLGFADFLVLLKDQNGKPQKDSQGRFIFEPVDAKSARTAKRAAVLQVASYAHTMVRLGMAMPPRVHLWLAGDEEWSAATSDLIDLAEEFETRARTRIENFTTLPQPEWGARREACIRCRWQEHCDTGRIQDRDLSLVYGVRSSTRLALIQAGYSTIDQLATATEDDYTKVKGEVSKETFNKLIKQAALQLKGEKADTLLFEVKDPSLLSVIPASSPGDIWFDMEGDPYSGNEGLEYMFGYLLRDKHELKFNTFVAESKAFEKQAFSDFITFVLERRKQYPDMHVYHYASYESATILRLAQRYGIHEREVDILKREGVFVDLLNVVRSTLRFSSDSLSIKSIEAAFYPGHRNDEVATAMESVYVFNMATLDLLDGNREEFEKKFEEIRKYNEVDCRSLQALDQWLRDRANENGIELKPVIALEHEEVDERTPEEIQLQAFSGDNPENRTDRENGAAFLSASISYHKREDKPTWWNIFDKATKDIDELESFDDVILPDKITSTNWDTTGRQRVPHRTTTYETSQSGDLRHVFDVGDELHLLYEHGNEEMYEVANTLRGVKKSKIIQVEENKIVIDETCGSNSQGWSAHPMALLPEGPVDGRAISDVIRNQLAPQVISNFENGQPPFPQEAWADILLRRPPRQRTQSLPNTDDHIQDITNALINSNNSYVAVQGPPGTGKTHVGAHVIASLVTNHNWKIGVVAQSHAVVENLFNSVLKREPTIAMAKKCKKASIMPTYHQEKVASWAQQQLGGYVIGGTAWTFAGAEVRALGLDLIVVEEAGQFSLTNTIASVSAGRNALLLGDPQQLPQVSQGNHPEPVNESALQHLLQGAKTMPDHMGYFLETTYRMHPFLAKPVSRLQYENRLHSDSRCSKRNLDNVESGLHILRLNHSGNTTKSNEEASLILTKIKEILGNNWTDTDKDGNPITPRPLDESDILVVTAYNAQVKNIKSRLNAANLTKIRVGTFDKFQGQEAPVVFVSMTTSTAEDLPRGMEFLLSPNRLNVAVSRAQWACYLIRSNNLSVMEPTSPEGMVMLGKFVTLCK